MLKKPEKRFLGKQEGWSPTRFLLFEDEKYKEKEKNVTY
jgi:hypothetical protein